MLTLKKVLNPKDSGASFAGFVTNYIKKHKADTDPTFDPVRINEALENYKAYLEIYDGRPKIFVLKWLRDEEPKISGKAAIFSEPEENLGLLAQAKDLTQLAQIIFDTLTLNIEAIKAKLLADEDVELNIFNEEIYTKLKIFWGSNNGVNPAVESPTYAEGASSTANAICLVMNIVNAHADKYVITTIHDESKKTIIYNALNASNIIVDFINAYHDFKTHKTPEAPNLSIDSAAHFIEDLKAGLRFAAELHPEFTSASDLYAYNRVDEEVTGALAEVLADLA